MPIKPRLPSEGSYCKMLVHSPAGNGKTYFLGTAQLDERTYPMAFLNFDAGDKTLAGLEIDVYDMRDFKDYEEAKAMLQHPQSPFKSVGIDSVSETQVAGIMDIIKRGAGQGADPDQLGQPGWGLILMQMRRFVRDFKFLPMHTFMTALSKDEVMPKRGMVQVPAVQGAFMTELSGVPDIVAYLNKEEVDGQERRVLYLHGYPKFMIKARTPWGVSVPTEIWDPTVTSVLDTFGYK